MPPFSASVKSTINRIISTSNKYINTNPTFKVIMTKCIYDVKKHKKFINASLKRIHHQTIMCSSTEDYENELRLLSENTTSESLTATLSERASYVTLWVEESRKALTKDFRQLEHILEKIYPYRQKLQNLIAKNRIKRSQKKLLMKVIELISHIESLCNTFSLNFDN